MAMSPSPVPPPEHHTLREDLAAEDSGWSMASGDVEQKYFGASQSHKYLAVVSLGVGA